MSYLNSLRLHFAGRFQANISTVNNTPGNFFNDAFGPKSPRQYSPQGDAAWRLLACKVTAAWLPSGKVRPSDPVLECIIADSDSQAPAKLVDLDPQQQMVSEIWGLQVRIADAKGNTLLTSDFEPAAFMDIWDPGGAMYQSVLRNLRWADVSHSEFLTNLKQETKKDGLLSIKFNVDRFNVRNNMTGRIVGTIGPAAASEPHHLILGRHFLASANGSGNFFIPAGGINHCVGVVDTSASCIFLDLGNALPTTRATGAPVDLGELTLGVYKTAAGTPFAAGAVTTLGTIPGYTSNDWYEKTAGVVVLPLTPSQLEAVASQPLVLRSGTGAFISEWSSGAFVAPDTFVYRMSPRDTVDMKFYLTQRGQPVRGATVFFDADPLQLQGLSGPPVAVPENAIQFNGSAVTDANGIAVLQVKTKDPGSPRNFNGAYGIDGQVYGIRASLDPEVYGGGPVDQWNFVSILLWSRFIPSHPVTWNDIKPTMVQYANLYPVMKRFLDLGDYDSVVANARLLTLAFRLDVSDPNSMPVTRDLSPAKRKAILSFLANPRRGKVRKPHAKVAPGFPPETFDPAEQARTGGKAEAAARRLVNLKGRRS